MSFHLGFQALGIKDEYSSNTHFNNWEKSSLLLGAVSSNRSVGDVSSSRVPQVKPKVLKERPGRHSFSGLHLEV